MFVVCAVVSRTGVVPLDMAQRTACLDTSATNGDLNSWSTAGDEERRRGQVTQERGTDEDHAYHVDSGSSG